MKPEKTGELPKGFRKMNVEERRETLKTALAPCPEEMDCSLPNGPALELADLMVESAVGAVPVPLGIATGFLIDGRRVDLPMATEEPSVIAAAAFAGGLIARSGGFETWATDPIMSGHVYLADVSAEGYAALLGAGEAVRETLASSLASLGRRGGGFRGFSVSRLPDTELVRADIEVDVRDAMGANILNGAAETLRPRLEALSGGRALMCILSNAAVARRAGARFALPLSELRRALAPGWTAEEAAKRLVLAVDLARRDPLRAVTHNKGIMNGVGALALATFNDWRAIEAAAHAWAARDGAYRGLGDYRIEGDKLVGELELPLPFATAGGAVSLHPSARLSLRILGEPDAVGLSRIAAALGLAQNLAALLALVTEGIQGGHMRLHAARLAYLAGARGEAARRAGELLAHRGSFDLAEARRVVGELGRGAGEGA